MAIEDIFKALDEQADAEVDTILRVATMQAGAIDEEAREEAERIIADKVGAAEGAARIKADKALNAARLKARRELASVRDAAIAQVFDTAVTELAGLRGTPAYESAFGKLLAEATASVSGECEVRVAASDAALAERLVAEAGLRCTVVPELDSIGGVVVALSDGHVLRVNTFESRMAKVRGLAAATIAEVLAGS